MEKVVLEKRLRGRNVLHMKGSGSLDNSLNSSVFWVITRRRLVKHRRFGTTYRSHLQGSSVFFLGHLILEDGTRQVVPKRRCLTNLPRVMTQKTEEVRKTAAEANDLDSLIECTCLSEVITQTEECDIQNPTGSKKIITAVH
jgi:hypothetical protein